MNAKYVVLMAIAFVFFSCNRSIVSIDKGVKNIQHSSGHEISSGPVASGEEGYQNLSSNGLMTLAREDRQNKAEVVIKRKVIGDSITTKDTSRKELKKRIKQEQTANKEMDPRLSRALLMTIFGGIATTLGIVFMGYAPTGLFVFAFGIVFLVGIVSLFMYLANPKPKM